MEIIFVCFVYFVDLKKGARRRGDGRVVFFYRLSMAAWMRMSLASGATVSTSGCTS